jgi:hypothetical protein
MNQTLWTTTAALVIGGAVRAIKTDTFPLSVPKRALPWLALVLGFASAALDARMNGVDWEAAAASGITATALAVFGHDVLRGVPGVTRLLSLAPLLLIVSAVSSCTPDARRALLEQGFDTVQCALANKHLPNDKLVAKCAIETGDLDRIMRIVGEARQASAKAAAEAEARGYEAGTRAASASRPLCPEPK